MPNYIESSRKISARLDAQGIMFKVDMFAPEVWRGKASSPLDCRSRYYVALMGREFGDEYVCPFFGPGGEGNLLKALRAWRKKQEAARFDVGEEGYAHVVMVGDDDKLVGFHGHAKTDGTALHDLLEKLMGEGK